MKCEIERMEINYTFYFFAFFEKVIKKLLTFCYWKDCEVDFDFCWCPSDSVQSETDRQSDLYGRTGSVQHRREEGRIVLLYPGCGYQYELSGRHALVVANNTIFIRNPQTNVPYSPAPLTDQDKMRIDGALMGRGLYCEFGFEPVNLNTGNFYMDQSDATMNELNGEFSITRSKVG